MRKCICIIGIIACFVSGALPEEVFVLNGLGRTISRIVPDDNSVENNIATTGDSPNQILASGEFLIVINSSTHNIMFYDLNTASFVRTVQLDEGTNPWNGYVCNDSLLFVTNWLTNDVTVIDLQSLSIRETFGTGVRPEGILVTERYILVTVTNFDLEQWTYGPGHLYIHDAQSYGILDSVQVSTNPQSLIMGGDGDIHVLCTGDYYSSFGRVDIVDPDSKVVVGSIPFGGSPGFMDSGPDGRVYISAGGWAYTGSPNGHLYSYDSGTHQVYNDSQNPILTHRGVISVTVDDDGYFYAACFDDDYIDVGRDSVEHAFLVGDGPQSSVVVEDSQTDQIADNQHPAYFKLEQNFPNPFNASTRIGYHLEKGGEVKLDIYDIRGNRVRNLVDVVSGAGRYEICWDGKDDRKVNLPSGVYFYRLQYNGHDEKRRMVYLR